MNDSNLHCLLISKVRELTLQDAEGVPTDLSQPQHPCSSLGNTVTKSQLPNEDDIQVIHNMHSKIIILSYTMLVKLSRING